MSNDYKEKYEELKKLSGALIDFIGKENCFFRDARGNNYNLTENEICPQYQDLKSHLKPSREDIADWLENFKGQSLFTNEYEHWFKLAVEELRRT